MHHYKFSFSDINDQVFKDQWVNLSESISEVSFYQEYFWIRTYLASCAAECEKNYILSLHYKGELIAVIPLQYGSAERYGMKIKVWKILWPNDMGVNDFLYEKNNNNIKLIDVLIRFLNNQSNPLWHMLELENIPETGAIAYSINKLSLPRHVKVYHHDSKHIKCAATYKQSIENFSSKFKRNNRRKFRKLNKLGEISFEYIFDEANLQSAYESFIKVESSNWKGDKKTSLMYDDGKRKFYATLLKQFGKAGRCVIHTLKLNGRPVASQFCIISGDTFNLLKVGYDAEFHSVGPGSILLDETLRRFSGHSEIKNINFITGAKWNDDWNPKVTQVYNHYIYNANVKGFIAYGVEVIISILRIIKHKLNG